MTKKKDKNNLKTSDSDSEIKKIKKGAPTFIMIYHRIVTNALSLEKLIGFVNLLLVYGWKT